MLFKAKTPSVLQAVENYFEKCHHAKIDCTSAVPVSPPRKKIKKIGSKAFAEDRIELYSTENDVRELKKTICKYFRNSEIDCDEENILISTSIFHIIQDFYSIIDWEKDGKILLPTPTFGFYYLQALQLSIDTEFIVTDESTGWKVTPEKLDYALKHNNIKVFILNNPINPTGKVYTKSELESLADVLKNYDVLVISDEVFQDIILKKDINFCSLAAIPSMIDQCVVVNGVSKSRCLAGIRVSFSYVPHEIKRLLPLNLCGLSKPELKVANEALKLNEENTLFLTNNNNKYMSNVLFIRKQLFIFNGLLSKLFGCQADYISIFSEIPSSTNVILLDFSKLKEKVFLNGVCIDTSLKMSELILSEKGIALAPGEAFFFDGSLMLIRIPLSHEKFLYKEIINDIFSLVVNHSPEIRMLKDHLDMEKIFKFNSDHFHESRPCSFFSTKNLKTSELVENRHEHYLLQNEYDKRFGLVLR